MSKIDWVEKNPEKFFGRLEYEMEEMKLKFPSFQFVQKNGGLYVEGPIITKKSRDGRRGGNVYLVRAYYPSNYPYTPPIPVVMDEDVVDHCTSNGMHDFHNYGHYEDGGLKLCVMKPDDVIGEGWKPKYSVVTIVSYISTWLHAYEYKRKTGKWLLPEA